MFQVKRPSIPLTSGSSCQEGIVLCWKSFCCSLQFGHSRKVSFSLSCLLENYSYLLTLNKYTILFFLFVWIRLSLVMFDLQTMQMVESFRLSSWGHQCITLLRKLTVCCAYSFEIFLSYFYCICCSSLSVFSQNLPFILFIISLMHRFSSCRFSTLRKACFLVSKVYILQNLLLRRIWSKQRMMM